MYWWELPYLGVVVCLDQGLSNLAGQHTIARIPFQCTLIHFQSSLRLWVGVLGEVVRVESDSTICYSTIMQRRVIKYNQEPIRMDRLSKHMYLCKI